jgi:hypothetical protein
MENYISKETPTWVINWVNKVFTLANTPNRIDDLFYDGAISVNYTLDGNVITMWYAPNLSIYVDYFQWEDEPTVSQVDTLWTIRSAILQNLWAKSTSSTFTETLLNAEINACILNILLWKVTNHTNGRRLRIWKLSFNESFANFWVQPWSTLTWEVSIWDTTIPCDTSWLYPSWYVQIWWDIIKYTWITSTTLTWVEWIKVNHNMWEKIVQLYKMPDNFDRSIRADHILKWDELRESEIMYSQYWDLKVCYNILYYETVRLVKVYGFSSTDMIRIKYSKKFYDLVNDNDYCPLPWHYWVTIVAKLVAWELWMTKMLPNAVQLMTIWFNNLRDMYDIYLSETTKPTVQIKRYWHSTIIR